MHVIIKKILVGSFQMIDHVMYILLFMQSKFLCWLRNLRNATYNEGVDQCDYVNTQTIST